jgi:hypothetical protein
MLKRFVLVAMCLIVLAGCAKKPSPTGGTVMSSGEIAFFYAPGWVVKKEDTFWRFEHPSAVAWGDVLVADEQTKTDDVIKIMEDQIAKKWGSVNVITREYVDIQERSVCLTKYRVSYYLTPFSGSAMYYGGKEGVISVITFVKSDQEWAIQKDMDNFMKGIAFKR